MVERERERERERGGGRGWGWGGVGWEEGNEKKMTMNSIDI